MLSLFRGWEREPLSKVDILHVNVDVWRGSTQRRLKAWTLELDCPVLPFDGFVMLGNFFKPQIPHLKEGRMGLP